MFNLKSIKTQLIIYLLIFALVIAIIENNYIFLKSFTIAVAAAALIELFILYFTTKSFKFTESSVITGMIIGYVLSSDEWWWKIALTAAFAIASKHLITFKKKHIFNPAAFGIFLAILVLGVSTQWKSTYLWYALVPFGIYFAQKIKKIELLVGYAFVSLALFGMQAVLQKVPLINIFGYFSYFYIFVMIVEPKTTPFKSMAKFIFGAGVAAFIFILTEAGVRVDAELFSLLMMNAAVPLLNKISFKQGGMV